MQKNENSHSLLMGMKNGIASLKNNLAVPEIVKHRVTIWASIFPRETNAYILTKTYTWMATVALFLIAQKWKQNVYQLMNGLTKCGIFSAIYSN